MSLLLGGKRASRQGVLEVGWRRRFWIRLGHCYSWIPRNSDSLSGVVQSYRADYISIGGPNEQNSRISRERRHYLPIHVPNLMHRVLHSHSIYFLGMFPRYLRHTVREMEIWKGNRPSKVVEFEAQ